MTYRLDQRWTPTIPLRALVFSALRDTTLSEKPSAATDRTPRDGVPAAECNYSLHDSILPTSLSSTSPFLPPPPPFTPPFPVQSALPAT